MIKNISSSVKERLLNISRKEHRDFNSLLLRYFQERLLYRMSISDYKNNFILKGGLLFLAYNMSSLRPTKDIDLLGYSLSNDLENISSIFNDIISIQSPDGVIFIPENIVVERIKTANSKENFEGVRVKLQAQLAEAKNNIQIDIGFGDKIVPSPIEINFPVLLNFPEPKIHVYSKESVIAEKFHSIVELEHINSRMKDFYDILFLGSHEHFNFNTLREAIYATFNYRKTSLEKRKVIFSNDFKTDKQKQEQWKAFLFKNKLSSYESFNDVVGYIELFLGPVCSEENTVIKNTNWNIELWTWI
jgi:predicted nucleotidyltransferase component of viral defense system